MSTATPPPEPTLVPAPPGSDVSPPCDYCDERAVGEAPDGDWLCDEHAGQRYPRGVSISDYSPWEADAGRPATWAERDGIGFPLCECEECAEAEPVVLPEPPDPRIIEDPCEACRYVPAAVGDTLCPLCRTILDRAVQSGAFDCPHDPDGCEQCYPPYPASAYPVAGPETETYSPPPCPCVDPECPLL